MNDFLENMDDFLGNIGDIVEVTWFYIIVIFVCYYLYKLHIKK